LKITLLLIILLVCVNSIYAKVSYELTAPSSKGSGCNLEFRYDNPPTRAEFKKEYEQLRSHILSKKWSDVATTYINFPFTARTGGFDMKTRKYSSSELKIESKNEFIKKAKVIFKEMPKLLAFEKMDFFCNAQGIMIFHGYLWFGMKKNKKIFIKTANYKGLSF